MKTMNALYKPLVAATMLGIIAVTAGCASSSARTTTDKAGMARFEERSAQNCSWQGPPKLSHWSCPTK